MDNDFEIPVTYASKEFNFPAKLIAYGYTYKIEVDVFGKSVSFERDEEQNFRAIINTADLQETGSIDKDLLAVIAEQLIVLF